MLYFIYNGVTTSTQATTAEQLMSTNFMLKSTLECFVYMPLSSITTFTLIHFLNSFWLIFQDIPERTNLTFCTVVERRVQQPFIDLVSSLTEQTLTQRHSQVRKKQVWQVRRAKKDWSCLYWGWCRQSEEGISRVNLSVPFNKKD